MNTLKRRAGPGSQCSPISSPGREPALLHDLAPSNGIARFDRSTPEIRLEAWPRWADPTAGDAPYAGWPVVFNQTDNYGRKAAGYLPRLEVEGLEDPVVTVINERSSQVVYTIRIRGTSLAPKVFENGPHTGSSLENQARAEYRALLASIRPVNSTRLYPSYSIRRYGSAFRDPAVQLYYLPIFWRCLHRTDQEP